MKQTMALDGTSGAGSRRTSFRQKPDGRVDPAGEAGWYLQYERERRGETLADAAVETRIKAKYLHAIELGALDQVPGWPYVIGYVRSYAKFLGLEPEPLAQHYLTFVRRPAIIERFAGRSLWFRRHAASRSAAAVAGTTAVILLGIWAAVGGRGGSLLPAEEETAAARTALAAAEPAADPVVTGSIGAGAEERDQSLALDAAIPTVRVKRKSLAATAEVEQASQAAVGQTDAETALAAGALAEDADIGAFIASRIAAAPAAEEADAAAPAGESGSRILLRARDNVWVRIEDAGGNALLNRTLARGEIYPVPDRDGLVLIVRDAGALEFSQDGAPYSRLGRAGQVVVSYPLVPGQLRSVGG